MNAVLTHDGKIVTQQEEIMAEAKDFYEKLYTEKTDVSLEDQNFFIQKIDKTLTSNQKEILDKQIELNELKDALFQCQREKTAGYDGLPYEFYQTFWHIIGEDFLNVVQFSLNVAKHLPYSQTTSIITLIYKKNDKMKLTNWRPISLLCCDYKIISKTLANRLKKVLDTILSERQTCSVPGRNITHNLHFIRDAIFFCDVRKINGYILCADQEKAFDMLNRDFLIKIMKKMNFGETFIQWIEVIFQDSIGRILLNGYISYDFPISRGVRQGCPLSADLYAIYIETLDLALNSDPHIFGLPIPGREAPKSSLYADDLTLILSDRTSIPQVFLIFSKFEMATGSKINPEKTQGLALGNPRLDHPEFENIYWKNFEGLEILGILFFSEHKKTLNTNWTNVIKEMETDLDRLKFRKLSLKGKTMVLNTVVLSKVWYTAGVLPLPEPKFKEIERLMFAFLWNGRQIDPIQRRTIYQPKEKGGLGLKNPKLQQQALQLKFLKDILNEENRKSWLQLPRYWIGFRLSTLNPQWLFLNTYPRVNPICTRSCTPYYKHLLETFKDLDLSKLPEIKLWTTRTFYSQLLEKDEHPTHSFTTFWETHRVNPARMWKHIYTSHALGPHQDVHFRFLHRVLPSNAFMKKRFHSRGYQNINTNCASCPNKIETNEHIFFRCVAAKPILQYIYPSIQLLLRNKPFKIFKLILNDFPTQIPDKAPKIVITIIQIAMHVIWNNRNKFKFQKEETHIQESKNKTNSAFKRIIKHKFDQHIPHRLAKFRENYCHTPELCNVVNNDTLQVQLI